MNREIEHEGRSSDKPAESRLNQDGVHALTNPESRLKTPGQVDQYGSSIPKDFGNQKSFDFNSVSSPYKDATQGQIHTISDGRNTSTPQAVTTPELHTLSDGRNQSGDVPQGSTLTDGKGGNNLSDGKNKNAAERDREPTTDKGTEDFGKIYDHTPIKGSEHNEERLGQQKPPAEEKPAPASPEVKDMWMSGIAQILGYR